MKLAAALTVPLLGLLFITAVEVAHTAHHVDRVRSQTQLARATVGPSGLLGNLQNERTWAVADLIGAADQIQAQVRGYGATRQATDQAVAQFREAVANEGPAVRNAYAPALARLTRLDQVRGRVDADKAPHTLDNAPTADKVFGDYSAMLGPFFDANTRVALAVDDTELRRWTTLTGIAVRQGETIADLARGTILDGVLGDGINTPDEITREAQLKSTFDRLNAQLRDVPQPYASVVERSFPTKLVDNLSAQVDAALKGRPVKLEPFLEALNIPPERGFIGLGQHLSAQLTARADTLDRQATARERLYVAIAIATLAGALLLSWLVTRSITRPLRSLTRQAKDMAERRLPDAVNDILDTPLGDDISMPKVEAVRIDTSDEVSDVATALTTVQETALDLAIEQAVLRRNIADSFVNLGRRNQSLLGRQLDFITELESNETDPDALADLFRLDHLATRMRRNAESLLVLAGFDPPRKWAAPVRLSDVIRAALGEVEDYHRVVVRRIEPATIVGSAAADLAHLLAELVENALVFSPPDQNVEIRGGQRNDGPPAGGAYTLAVIDTGLGMPAADLAAANRRLAGAESFTIAPSKYLGHYVAGNLAARHGIVVHLDNSPGNGVTATITLPISMLTAATVTSDPVTPPHGQRAMRLRPGMAVPGPRGHTPALRPGATPGPVPAPAAAPPGPAPASAPQPTPAAQVSPVPEGGPAAAGTAAPAPAAARAPRDPGEPEATHFRVPLHVPDPPDRTAAPGPHRLPAREGAGGPGLPRRPVPGGAIPGGPVPTGAPPPALWPRPGTGPGGIGGGATRPAPPRPDDDSLLQALGRYAPPPGQGRGGTAPRPGRQPLTPRVKGAQLPQTGIVPLRAEDRGRTRPGAAPPVPRSTPAAHASAADVQSLLTSFSAGVQRGLAESRQRYGAPTGNGTSARNGRR